jgi:AraC-like DNA-binding protein
VNGHPKTTAPSWDFRRGPNGVRIVVEMAIDNGMSARDCLKGTTLAADQLNDASTEIEAADELRVARNVIAKLGDQPGLGVQAGLRYTLASAGILGFALLSSRTLRDATAVGLRYIAASSAFVCLAIEEDGARARLLFDDDEIPDDVRAFFVERDLTAVANVIPGLLGRDPRQISGRLELRMTPTRGSLLAALMPGGSIEFRQRRNALSFPRTLLDEPLPQADQSTAEMCERQCRELVEQRQARHGVAAAVRSRLIHQPGRPPSMDTIAEELHIDTRTLRRHLEREGSSYRALLDEVRDTLAVEMLTTAGLTVSEVAARLGYAEPASFTHAFTRWRGVPPSEYRRTAARG